MFVDSVKVIENGSLNGRVCHESLSFVSDIRPYTLSMSSAGRGHEKHGGDKGPGAAGQDVYGHTRTSIFVSDGHGKDGLEVARESCGIVSRLESVVSVELLQSSPDRLAEQLRICVVEHMHRVASPVSGATFTQMMLIESNGRRWAITVNVGDSEALLVYRNRVHVCSVPHAWDNLTMYQRYIQHSRINKPVCYNRWNASDYRLRGPLGTYRPIMMYEVRDNRARVHKENAEWISKLWERRSNGKLRYGTQSVRIPDCPHENWGSCVVIGGRARGQVMAGFGDVIERQQTGVPLGLVHVYIHEIPCSENVVAVVQSDGVSNSLTLGECGRRAWTCRSAEEYLSGAKSPRDDISVGIARFLVAE
tara:strand:+ start:874 stop:1962 length:1089 start_codon:yes stop_codon:yes gene_type:complete